MVVVVDVDGSVLSLRGAGKVHICRHCKIQYHTRIKYYLMVEFDLAWLDLPKYPPAIQMRCGSTLSV